MLSPKLKYAQVTLDFDGQPEIRWAVQPEGCPVSVYAADSGESAPGQQRLIAADLRGGRLGLNDIPSRQRIYFTLRAGREEQLTVAERVLPLQGARNFRDLGGYPTSSGRRIKWGLLFRSDYLAHLSDEDCEYIRDIGICTVFDLRGNIERQQHPSRWHPQSRVETVCWEDSRDAGKLGQHVERYRRRHALDRDDNLRGFLSYHYRKYLEAHAHKYRQILERLSGANAAPALIHCTAGKDRTGIVVALLLYVLGVKEDLIMQDYLITNERVSGPDERERFRMLLRQFGINQVSDDGVDSIRLAHAEYLEAAFRGMREDYGSVDEYLEGRLGIGAAETAALRLQYLEQT
jgi:protein-tyrosine phosphatase